MTSPQVSAGVSKGRGPGLAAIVKVLVASIEAVDDAQVPALAGQLVDALKRVGGGDATLFEWLRDELAVAVDRVAAVQGSYDDKDRPLGTELAGLVRQLIRTIDEIAVLPVERPVTPGKVRPDELAARRARRIADATAVPAPRKGKRISR